MQQNYRLIPIWVLILAIILIVTMCSCIGGRSLNTNSSGIKSVITPSSPNKNTPKLKVEPLPPPSRVSPPVEPLTPTPIAPKRIHTDAVRSNPVIPEPQPAKANPFVVNPKPAGNPEPFSPTVSPAPKLIEGDGGCVVITDNKSTDPQVAGPEPSKEDMKINWTELIMFYGTGFMLLAIGVLVYQMVTKKKKNGKRKKIRTRNNKKT